MTPQFLIVHHSFTPRDLPLAQAENSFNNNHRDRGFPRSSLGWYIGYHYVIYGQGEVKQYRADTEPGAHTKEQEMNFKSLGICLSGNFDVELPSDAQVEALRGLLISKSIQFNIPIANIYPHRKFAPYKSCYGQLLNDNWARNLLTLNPTGDRGVIIKKSGEATLYLPEGDVLVPFSVDYPSFQQDFGSATVVELSPQEFAKFKVSHLKIVKN